MRDGEGARRLRRDTMDILYLLVPLSVVLVFVIGAVFWFALRSGQFDDLVGPGLRILADDDGTPKETGK